MLLKILMTVRDQDEIFMKYNVRIAVTEITYRVSTLSIEFGDNSGEFGGVDRLRARSHREENHSVRDTRERYINNIRV